MYTWVYIYTLHTQRDRESERERDGCIYAARWALHMQPPEPSQPQAPEEKKRWLLRAGSVSDEHQGPSMIADTCYILQEDVKKSSTQV